MDIHANTSWVSVFQVLVWKKYARLPSIILIDCNVTSFKICRLRIPAGMACAAVCKEFSRVEAGRKCSQRKSRHVSDVPLLFVILIAHCQAAASLFDDCSTKKSRQVNLDTIDSHPDLSSWQPIGSLFVDGLHLPPTATPCVVDALDKAGVFEGGAAQCQHVHAETSRSCLPFRCRPCAVGQLPPRLLQRRWGRALRCNTNKNLIQRCCQSPRITTVVPPLPPKCGSSASKGWAFTPWAGHVSRTGAGSSILKGFCATFGSTKVHGFPRLLWYGPGTIWSGGWRQKS